MISKERAFFDYFDLDKSISEYESIYKKSDINQKKVSREDQEKVITYSEWKSKNRGE